MIKALLVDDEPLNISNLKALLERHCPTVEILGTALSVDQAQTLIEQLQPDVVFLDIEMPDKNGFELLKCFSEPNFEVVFVTAYNHYGIQAIKFSALDYLLKPINIEELKKTVAKLQHSIQRKSDGRKLQNLLKLIDQNVLNSPPKIALPTLKETYFVAVTDILRCESSNNYTSIYLINGTEHVISKPIYEFEDMLKPHGFIRCHQSHLVNKQHITSILNQDAGYLVLNNSNKNIPISKQKKALVMEILKN